MQLKLQRFQRAKGLTASAIFFCLDVRADYTSEEKININRYRLGGQTIYNSRAAQRHLKRADEHLERTEEGTVGNRLTGLARGMMSTALAKMQLTISIASLGRGHHIECKDMEELLESEDTIRNACKSLTRYLEVANTFDGSEVVIEYVNGVEQVHVAQSALPLLTYEVKAKDIQPIEAKDLPIPTNPTLAEMGKDFAKIGANIKNRWLAFESGVLTFTAVKGWSIDEIHVRIAAGVLGFVALIALYEIF